VFQDNRCFSVEERASFCCRCVAEPEQDADDMDEMMREVGDDADAVVRV